MENKSNRRPREKREKSEFDQAIVDIARVTRVMAGGKRMSFRACVVVGDHQNRVGAGLAKGRDVSLAVAKAAKQAEKNIIKVNLKNGTIPHGIKAKMGAAEVLLKPAPAGTGVISGGAARIVLEMAGIKNVVSKILGSNNKINNVKATIKALSQLKAVKGKEKEKDKAKVLENLENNNKE